MAVSPFNHNGPNRDEQNFVESLIIESIQIKGMDVEYLLREKVNPDELFGESTISNFTERYTVEMYLEEVNQFNGDGDIFGKFGMEFTDTATFQVSSRRFKEELDGVQMNGNTIERPREGDLIYLPLSDSLWEIKKVKMDREYFQLGRNYTYRLVCDLFQYSHEQLATDEPEISDFNSITDIAADEDGLKRLLSIDPTSDFSDEEESESIHAEAQPNVVKTFDPNNPFGE